MNSIRAALPVAILLLAAGTAAAQDAPAGAETRVSLGAAALPPGARIEIDGRPDEAAWAAASAVSGFVQRQPSPGAPASMPTDVRVLQDGGAVYVAARLREHPDSVTAQLGRRDASGLQSDWFAVLVDSDRDERTAHVFAVNPAGVQRDLFLSEDGSEDVSWDAVWDAAAARDSAGWTVEFRIPLSQLRFTPGRDAWGINFRREAARRGEVAYWAPLPPDAPGVVSRFGLLTGMAGLTTPRRLELRPYVLARTSRAPGEVADPFHSPYRTAASGGLDFRYGISANLSLTGTINPDFGQVEADPSVVNLTAFETFFAERRPFFVEGAEIFRFGLGGRETLFYSRRIGRGPRGRVPGDARYRDVPEASTILGAVKLSGKTADGWSVGLLNAVTAREVGRFVGADGEIGTAVVEPRTNYAVGRVIRDLRGGRSAVGAVLTATHRETGAGGLDLLPTAAWAGGVDGRHRFGGDNYEVSAWALASHVSGDSTALRVIQRAPARYFHRPDAPHLRFDPSRTALAGSAAGFRAAKIGGGHWRAGTEVHARAPGFEVNDLGFLNTADQVLQAGYVGFEQFRPGGGFREWRLYATEYAGWTHAGERTAAGWNVNGNYVLQNLWRGYGGVEGTLSTLSVTALRGGPAIRAPGAFNAFVGISGDPRTRWTWSLDGGYWRERESRGWAASGGPTLRYRPSSRADLSLSTSLSAVHAPWQYVTQAATGGGREFVFAEMQQRTLSLTARINYTFTPDLSLQLYAQPFFSAGDFSRFKRVSDPRARRFGDRFEPFGEDRLHHDADGGRIGVDFEGDGEADLFFGNPDFNARQFRSNAVLRWEYRPGSTLFVVWGQSRSDGAVTGTLRPWEDARDLFGAPGTNVLLVKASYWLNP